VRTLSHHVCARVGIRPYLMAAQRIDALLLVCLVSRWDLLHGRLHHLVCVRCRTARTTLCTVTICCCKVPVARLTLVPHGSPAIRVDTLS